MSCHVMEYLRHCERISICVLIWTVWDEYTTWGMFDFGIRKITLMLCGDGEEKKLKEMFIALDNCDNVIFHFVWTAKVSRRNRTTLPYKFSWPQKYTTLATPTRTRLYKKCVSYHSTGSYQLYDTMLSKAYQRQPYVTIVIYTSPHNPYVTR